jgi:hypothetical protein
MADKVTIVNRALSLLGAEPITALTDNTPEAQIASRMYDESRKSILSEAPWTFALKRDELNQTTDTVEWYENQENYIFQLPSDIIRIWRINADSVNWRIEQEYLICDSDEVGILYVFDQTDTTKYSSAFVDAFSDKLAADMCYAIINSNTEAKMLLEKYEGQSLPKATAINAQTGTPREIDDNLWSLAKYGFTPVNRNGIIIA